MGSTSATLSHLAAHCLEATGKKQEEATQTLEALLQMSASVAQCDHIIGIIEEISFQTKLLAVNAAVEATRAGSRSKGFAVLADNMGHLVQRNIDVCKEFQDLSKRNKLLLNSCLGTINTSSKDLAKTASHINEVIDLNKKSLEAQRTQSPIIAQVKTTIDQVQVKNQENNVASKHLQVVSHELANKNLKLKGIMQSLDCLRAKSKNAYEKLTGQGGDQNLQALKIISHHKNNGPRESDTRKDHQDFKNASGF
ncbi:MAG: hypothetical protein HRU09_11780 [Oligoflexales bacterium]|nr:hypothetical protein [Oligoflexales bacterium]